MIEIKNGFYVDTLEEYSKKHMKNIFKDIHMLKDIKNYTLNTKIINMAIELEYKIMENKILTKKDLLNFQKLNYLYYLKNFFPLKYDTIDTILKEYDFLVKL